MHDPRLRTGVRLEGGERRAFQGPAGPPRPVLSVAVEQRWWFLVTEDPFPRLLSPAVMKQLLHPSFRTSLFLSFFLFPAAFRRKRETCNKIGDGGIVSTFSFFSSWKKRVLFFSLPVRVLRGKEGGPVTNLYTPVTVATSLSLPLSLSLRGEKSTGGRATGRVPNSVFFFFFSPNGRCLQSLVNSENPRPFP